MRPGRCRRCFPHWRPEVRCKRQLATWLVSVVQGCTVLMAVTVTRAVWQHSKSKGNHLLVLLALADFVGEEKVQRGAPALAFPSQATLAEMCRCQRSTVQLALEALKGADEIRDTGERHWGRYRGTVEWEVLPSVDLFAADVTEIQAPENRSGDVGVADLTDLPPRPDRFTSDLTDLPPRPDRQIGHKPVKEPVRKPVNKAGSAPPAPDLSPPVSPAFAHGSMLLERRREWREVLQDYPHEQRATKKIADLEDELDRHLVETLGVAA
jgi:hypothetical protein